MRSRNFKIKDTKTGQFWSGYGSAFSDRGSDFASWDAAAYEVNRQIGRHHITVRDWIKDAAIIEYEVSITEVGSEPLIPMVERSKFYERLKKDYGREFIKNYSRFYENKETRGKYKFAIQVVNSDYAEFRESMKNLGFSSRHYKKTDSWLWIEDEQVMLRAKLLDYVVRAVYLENEEKILQENIDRTLDKI
jgi:hypothetical protein